MSLLIRDLLRRLAIRRIAGYSFKGFTHLGGQGTPMQPWNVPQFLSRQSWKFYKINSGSLSLPESAEEFDRDFDDLVKEIERIIKLASAKQEGARKKSKLPPPPMHSAKSLLKILVYQLGLHCMNEDEEAYSEILINRIIRNGGRVLGRKSDLGRRNVFFLCFRAIFSERMPISYQEISKLAKQLQLARECGVPPVFLIGFIYQTGKLRFRPEPVDSKAGTRIYLTDHVLESDDWG